MIDANSLFVIGFLELGQWIHQIFKKENMAKQMFILWCLNTGSTNIHCPKEGYPITKRESASIIKLTNFQSLMGHQKTLTQAFQYSFELSLGIINGPGQGSFHSKWTFCKLITANCKLITANCKSITANRYLKYTLVPT